MSGMGIQCCRFSVEWGRVEPEDGVFDEQAIARCREEIQAMAEQGRDWSAPGPGPGDSAFREARSRPDNR